MSQTLEGIVVSAYPQWTLLPLLNQLNALCDKVTLIADMDSPHMQAIARVADEAGIEEVRGMFVGGYIENVLPELYRAAECDWVIRLDDDELLSKVLAHEIPTLLNGGKPANLDVQTYSAAPPIDYYHIARAHVVGMEPMMYVREGFVRGGPQADWWPNLQLRLFRRGHCKHAGALHEGPEGVGVGTRLYAPIIHTNTLKPLEERERVCLKYRAAGGDFETRGDTALWERYGCIPQPCPYPVWEP